MSLSLEQEMTLAGGGECYMHFHPEDRVVTHDTVQRLQQLEKIVTISADYTILLRDDWIVVSGTHTTTLPAPRSGTQFRVVNSGTGTVTIASPSGITINGGSSVTLTSQWTSKLIKQISPKAYVAI